jgi:hypothetical protein
LALAMKDVDNAEKYLSVLAGLNFSCQKDIASLLDRVAELRKVPCESGSES